MNRKLEPKSRKVTLGFRPSVYTQFQKIAYIQNKSPNSVMSDFMDDYVEKNQRYVEMFDNLQEQKQS